MYAQDNNSLTVWSIFCHQLTNPYLHQFSTIFGGNCIRVIGARIIPLAYVIRIDPQVPGPAPTLAPNQPHSTEHGSVEGELIARASHTHALFRDDNSVVYYHLEEATRGASYAASIKPFQRGKDGRGAWKALTSQHAGKDKWEAEINNQEQLLHTRIWKEHRNAYVSMQASAEHVQYRLPNEHSRVGFLLEVIQCSDPGLQAVLHPMHSRCKTFT